MLPGLFLSTSTCAAHAGAAEQRQLCILAVDHDRCAANIAKGDPAKKKTKELATLLLAFAKEATCTYLLVTFSNRQHDKVNEWLNKGDKPPRVNILQLSTLKEALALAEPKLAERLEVYPDYVVPASHYADFETKESWEADLKNKVSKAYIVDEVFKLFGDKSRLFVFVDDNFALLPAPEEGAEREVRCIQFAPSVMGPLPVEWNKRWG